MEQIKKILEKYPDFTVLIDNGHGKDTPGKCSPLKEDGTRLYEWQYCRHLAQSLLERLQSIGINAKRIVLEDKDISLGERCKRINRVCDKVGSKNVIALSLHLNACGSGAAWCKATGYSEWICSGASSRTKRLAQLLYAEAERLNLQGNRSVPAQKYWTAEFYILKHTKCSCVLTESAFQDSKEDVAFLESEEGMDKLVELHTNAVLEYMKLFLTL